VPGCPRAGLKRDMAAAHPRMSCDGAILYRGLVARRHGRWWGARNSKRQQSVGFRLLRPTQVQLCPLLKLAELGYDEGRNVSIEYRWAEFHPERFPKLAADLVQKQVSLIAAVSGQPSIRAAKNATTEIPVVFLVTDHPVRLGLVESLNRPGGNLTGVAAVTAPVVMKQIELMNEVFPGNAPVSLLIDPTEAADIENAAHTAEQKLNRRVNVVHAASEADLSPPSLQFFEIKLRPW
jgi:ABC transporter substrate binding protein